MHAATAPSPVFNSAMSLAPGRPRPLARRLAIHNRVMHSVRHFMDDRQFNEIPVSYPSEPHTNATASSQQTGYHLLQGMVNQGFPAVWCEGEQNAFETNDPNANTLLTGFKLIQASMAHSSADDLANMMESLVKSVVAALGADLLGGRHIVRLDRMLSLNHPRLSYDLALEIVNHRGFAIEHGQTIAPDALATLSRYNHNLPFMLTNLPGTHETLIYVFPFAGQLGHGLMGTHASFTLELAPLLQYVMGLASIDDAVIHPLGPLSPPPFKAHQGRA